MSKKGADNPQKDNLKSIEEEQEKKLKQKYPNMKGPTSAKGSFLQKRINKGQKYFDSGDYNMAKSSLQGVKPPPSSIKVPLSDFKKPPKPLTINTTVDPATVTGDAIPTPESLHQNQGPLSTSKLVSEEVEVFEPPPTLFKDENIRGMPEYLINRRTSLVAKLMTHSTS